MGEGIEQSKILMSVPDNATAHGTLKIDGSVSASNAGSLHLIQTNANYQVASTGRLKLVVQVRTSLASMTFKVWKSTSADSAIGTTIYDMTNSTLSGSDIITTHVLDVPVTANDYINIENNNGSGALNTIRTWYAEYSSS